MFYVPEKLRATAMQYCNMHGKNIIEDLGRGLQGMVFATNQQSAIKVHCEKSAYYRERDVYLRLKECDVNQLRDFIVPSLVDFDDNFLLLEMSLVSPPFVLDFGGAYLDYPPEHMTDFHLRRDWLKQQEEQFGENWGKVKTALAELEARCKIYVADVNTRNIQF